MPADMAADAAGSFDGEALAMAALRRKNEVIDELQERVAALEAEVGATREAAAREVREQVEALQAELGVAQRAQRRAEGVGRDEVRQRERQILSQAAELRRLQTELAQAQVRAAEAEAQLRGAPEASPHKSSIAASAAAASASSESAVRATLRLQLETVRGELGAALLQVQALHGERDAAASAAAAARSEAARSQSECAAQSRQLVQLQRELVAAGNGNGNDNGNGNGGGGGGDSEGGAAPASAVRGSMRGASHTQRASSDVRAKDKQIVEQAKQIAALQGEVATLRQRCEEAAQKAQGIERELLTRGDTLAQQRAVLDDALAQLEQHDARYDALAEAHATADKQGKHYHKEALNLRQHCDALRAEVAQLQHNRVQAQRAASSVEEKDARLVTLGSIRDQLADQVESLEEERRQLQRRIEKLTALHSEKDEVHIALVRRKETQLAAAQGDVEQLRSSVEAMRNQLRDKTMTIDELTAQLADVTAQRDQEREAWRTRTTQSEVRFTTERENAKVAETRRSKLEEELMAQITNLTAQNAALLHEKRTMAAQLSAVAVDGAGKRSNVQRLSLEIEELKQSLQRLTRDYQRKCEDYDRLLQRMCDMEGSQNDAMTTASRRLVGVLESLSVEVSSQLAEHLRLDYLRGGVKTANVMIGAFGLERGLAHEVITVLCKLMFFVRIGRPMEELAATVGARENTIKRIVTAFAQAGERWASTERHAVLERDTPANAKVTFCGAERLALLCAIHREEASVHRVAAHPWVAACVCSFLPCVVQGAPFFAAHALTTQVSDGKPQGHTAMVALDFSSGTFNMLECEVGEDHAIVVSVAGAFKLQVSKSSPSSAKLGLQCRRKRDGSVSRAQHQRRKQQQQQTQHGNGVGGEGATAEGGCGPAAASSGRGGVGDDGGSGDYEPDTEPEWQWSTEEQLPRDEAPIIQYTIRWDPHHDGLVADGAAAVLREVSLKELIMLQELYGGQTPLRGMTSHRSWDCIPAPAPLRRPAGASRTE